MCGDVSVKLYDDLEDRMRAEYKIRSYYKDTKFKGWVEKKPTIQQLQGYHNKKKDFAIACTYPIGYQNR